MNTYSWCQWCKDFIAIPLFFVVSHNYSDSRAHLALFFALGCFVDTVFVSWYMCQRKPYTTFASVKDMMGMCGMFVFSLALVYANVVSGPSRWPIFFIVAIIIDSLSVLSMCTRFNIYTLRIYDFSQNDIVFTYENSEINV